MPVKRKKFAYDVVVLGGGSAGLSAAFAARRAGAKVAMVAAGKLGGDCPNYACVPTKSLLAAATLYDEIRRSGKMGIHVERVSFDITAVMARKDGVVDAMTGRRRLEKILEQEGVTLFRGEASFVDDEAVRVGTHILSARAFVIATGSVPRLPPITGLDAGSFWTPHEATSLKQLPESLAILGAGPVGCEFATFFSLCGVSVVLFDTAARILPREDEDLSILAQKELVHHGVTFFGNTRVLGAAKRRDHFCLTYQTGDLPRKTLKVEHVLVAAGRKPNVASLGIENTALVLDTHGDFVFDASLRIRRSSMFVAGDVSGLFPYTHTAHKEGVIAGENAARLARGIKKFQKIDLSVVPRVTFVMPELASVGKTAEELRRDNVVFATRTFPVGALGRAVIEGERIGCLKVFSDPKTDVILGAHMLGFRAGEVIHELALAMFAQVPISRVMEMIHAYPTMSEAIPGLVPGDRG